jgi:hypothetical protein
MGMAHDGTASSIWGQLTPASMRKVVALLANSYGMNSTSVFVDIGSGFGRPCFAAALFGHVALSWGIELVGSRVAVARRAWDAVSGRAPASARVEFRHGDARLTSMWPRTRADSGPVTATHVFGFDRDFDSEVTEGIAKVINASPAVRVLVTFMKEREWTACGLRGFKLVDMARGLSMAGSGSGCTAYVLVRSRARGKGTGAKAETGAPQPLATALASTSSAASSAPAASAAAALTRRK